MAITCLRALNPTATATATVDAADYTVWRNTLGTTVVAFGAESGSVAAPEPTSWLLLILAGAGGGLRWRSNTWPIAPRKPQNR